MRSSRWICRSALAFAALLLGAHCGMAGAQVPGTPRNGPDVVVGNLISNDTSNLTIDHYTPSGNTIQAYGLGTLSCNFGTVPLAWRADSADHPVIAQNMYRLTRTGLPNGNLITRVEQIGQAWLKHGFTALQGSECQTCQPFPNGAALGVGCSDPYVASLNGTQIGLGPKSEINPTTGVFPFPWTLNPAYSGQIARRLQVARADLVDPTLNAVFMESQYIGRDDAAAGNDNNNCTYRRASISGATLDLVLTDSAQRGRPAIFGWYDYGQGINFPDPDVNIVAVDVPGDGRYYIGVKVTDRGGGLWNYEYAIQNIQSDRSGGSFVVPLPAGASISNAGFRGAQYHSNEAYDNTPWAPTIGASTISWTSAQTFAQNPNAGALRWGTLSNFRFDANVPPGPGTVRLGLFKPGAGAFAGINAVLAALPVPGGGNALAPGTPPINDDCSGAIPLTRDSYAFSNTGATTGGPTECTLGGSNLWQNDVWFTYTWPGPCTGTVAFNTCGSTYDSRLAVYAVSSCPSLPGTALACDEDSGACAGGAAITIPNVAPGATFIVRVGATGDVRGQGVINVSTPICAQITGGCCFVDGSCSALPSPTCAALGGTFEGTGVPCVPNPCPPPELAPNDLCADALAVADTNVDGDLFFGSTLNATPDGTEAGCGGLTLATPDVWYTYVPAVSASVTVDLCQNPGFDTVLSVRRAGPGGGCSGSVEIACNDDFCGAQSSVTFAGTAGLRYYFRVSGYSSSASTPGESGLFTLRVSGGAGVIPSNDTCPSRVGIGLGTVTFNTANANTDAPALSASKACAGTPFQTDRDVFFNYPSSSSGLITASTCGSSFDTRIAIYAGSSCADWNTRLFACDDDDSACAPQSLVTFPVTAGVNYTIRVGGANGAGGPGMLTLSLTPTTGACCAGSTCSVVGAFACTGPNTAFRGAGTVCNAPGDNTTPCCRADFNQDGTRLPTDVFTFLNAYFAGSVTTDFNASGTRDPADIFGYLNAYFAGGC